MSKKKKGSKRKDKEKNEKKQNIGIKMSKEKLKISNIFYLNLKSPIIVEKTERKKKSKNKFQIYYRDLNIWAQGPTFEDCLKNFQEQLYLYYKISTAREDNELAKNDRKIKNKFLNLIKIES